ncbi:hypothetical protein MIND_01350600 [Mycena indigotica]|uniref:DUF6699 domain-containing protein n=1 Tax=Mycena indigotica TaxID=2126181 RepID=A0A8H6RZF4_9AGAR|nr:uncharacterized protein MIND_01350600 [Mycena indigotica]KAF7289768.1 hypothetical protein MIND_01350600 [Mycena indigotica]
MPPIPHHLDHHYEEELKTNDNDDNFFVNHPWLQSTPAATSSQHFESFHAPVPLPSTSTIHSFQFPIHDRVQSSTIWGPGNIWTPTVVCDDTSLSDSPPPRPAIALIPLPPQVEGIDPVVLHPMLRAGGRVANVDFAAFRVESHDERRAFRPGIWRDKATTPGLPSLTVMIPELPWVVVAHASIGGAVHVGDVFKAIWSSLSMRLEPELIQTSALFSRPVKVSQHTNLQVAMLTLAATSEPRLPAELERKVFRLAAKSDWQAVLPLLLVAQRVRVWVQPLLFHVVRINDSPHSRAFIANALANPAICSTVRYLSLEEPLQSMDKSIIAPIVRQCILVAEVAISSFDFNTPEYLNAIASFQSNRGLTVNIGSFFRPQAIDGMHAAFANITHLTLLDYILKEFVLTNLCASTAIPALPSLTHLRLKLIYTLFPGSPALLQKLVGNCPHLKLLLLVVDTDISHQPIPIDDMRALCASDPQTRIMFIADKRRYNRLWSDWEYSARGADNDWNLANDFIQRKRAGFVEPDKWWIIVK